MVDQAVLSQTEHLKNPKDRLNYHYNYHYYMGLLQFQQINALKLGQKSKFI